MAQHLRRFIFSLSLITILISPQLVWAQDIDLQDLALPSDVKDLGKTTGAVFYSSTNKNKPLMPVHMWGEVNRSGLHYIPVDTKLVKGLSFAGGGTGSADLEEVTVTRIMDGKVQRKEFDLTSGGSLEAHDYVLKPGDTVFVSNDRFYTNRAYYTSLVGVVVGILSSVLLYQRIQDTRNN